MKEAARAITGPLWMGALACLALLALGAGCYNPRLQEHWGRGSQLNVGVGAIRVTDEVIFSQEGEQKVIRPAEGKTLAAVPMTVVNNKAANALLLVSEEAASLKDAKFRPYSPIDPFERAVSVEGPVEKEKVFTPFLWGEYELERDFQVSGWLIFEVPPDREWEELEWRQGDTIVVRFGS